MLSPREAANRSKGASVSAAPIALTVGQGSSIWYTNNQAWRRGVAECGDPQAKPLAIDDGCTPVSQKSRFQFTLRSLLLVTTLAGILFAALLILGVVPIMALACASIPTIVFLWCFLALHRSVVSASNEDLASPQTIAIVPSDLEAAPIVDELSRNGIRASAVGGYTSGFQAEAPGQVHVVVTREDSERAQEVLSDFRQEECDFDWSEEEMGNATET